MTSEAAPRWISTPTDGFVLAGGRSSRMGRDKALLEIGGQPLIEIAVGLLRAAGVCPRVCGARPDLDRFAPQVADNYPGCGPLAGIEAALAVSASELNLFLPVDLPVLPVEFLRWMLERAQGSQAVATVPSAGGRPQPLCGVYSRRLLPGIRASLEAGKFKVITAIEGAAESLGEGIDGFVVESVAAAVRTATWPLSPPPYRWFRNINSNADFENLKLEFGSGANPRHPIS